MQSFFIFQSKHFWKIKALFQTPSHKLAKTFYLFLKSVKNIVHYYYSLKKKSMVLIKTCILYLLESLPIRIPTLHRSARGKQLSHFTGTEFIHFSSFLLPCTKL